MRNNKVIAGVFLCFFVSTVFLAGCEKILITNTEKTSDYELNTESEKHETPEETTTIPPIEYFDELSNYNSINWIGAGGQDNNHLRINLEKAGIATITITDENDLEVISCSTSDFIKSETNKIIFSAENLTVESGTLEGYNCNVYMCNSCIEVYYDNESFDLNYLDGNFVFVPEGTKMVNPDDGKIGETVQGVFCDFFQRCSITLSRSENGIAGVANWRNSDTINAAFTFSTTIENGVGEFNNMRYEYQNNEGDEIQIVESADNISGKIYFYDTFFLWDNSYYGYLIPFDYQD